MKNIYLKQFLTLLLINFFIAIIGYALEFYVFDFFYSIYSVSLFFFLSTYILVVVLSWVNANFKEYVGFAFMGLVLLKGLASILFLVPSFINEPKPEFTDLMMFFIPYFFFLVYEVIFSLRLINANN